MPVQIGAKAHNFSDPTGLLTDCHRRIEMFLGALESVAKVIDKPPDDETRQALENALRYFHDAAPKHTADEEESLFPRLRALSKPEVESAFSKLEHLEKDHRWAEPLHAEVEKLGIEYLSRGELSHDDVARFRSAVAQLALMYKQHIALEDEILFPLASQVLDSADKSAIADEMARRRKVKLVELH